MRMDVEARHYGSVDVAPLRRYIEERGEAVWTFSCQGIPALEDCRRIVLRHSRNYEFDLHDVVDWELMEDFRPFVEPITTEICRRLGKERLAAVFVANLPAGADIFPHVDRGEFLEVPSRVHVPVKTNPHVFYNLGGAYIDADGDDASRMDRQVFAKRIHMAEGEVWEIDNMSYHSVRNGGDTDRWHLVLNVW